MKNDQHLTAQFQALTSLWNKSIQNIVLKGENACYLHFVLFQGLF